MWARWSKTIGEGTRSRIGITSMILTAEALIWMCQPRSLTRLDRGSLISGVVAPVRGGLHKHVGRRPDALLQRAIVLHRRVGRPQRRLRIDGVLGVVD